MLRKVKWIREKDYYRYFFGVMSLRIIIIKNQSIYDSTKALKLSVMHKIHTMELHKSLLECNLIRTDKVRNNLRKCVADNSQMQLLI